MPSYIQITAPFIVHFKLLFIPSACCFIHVLVYIMVLRLGDYILHWLHRLDLWF